jgi:alkanesulfonate monooxygenase SsuD/methylene tetrahydromethanopterin reductase-like flavin-dependent oxidoreductase (luciferase family)
VGVGGSPESVVRAARYGLPLTLAIIGGDPRRFLPYIQLYHQALDQLGHARLPVAVHSHGYVADSDAQARSDLFEPWRDMRNRIGTERGWPPTTMREFEAEAEAGSLYVGSPETVARRIAATVRAMGIARFTIKYSAGTLSHEKMMRCIELYGREVIPRVRRELASRPD